MFTRYPKSMKLKFTFLLSFFLTISAMAQIEGDLLLGLEKATTAEMNSVNNPITGTLIYNTTENKVYQYNGSNWIMVGGSSSGWGLSGNSASSDATNFLGTTDLQDLVLKSNNSEQIRLVKDRNQVLINQASVFNTHPLVIKANGVDVLAFEDNTGTPKWHWNLLGNGLNFVESNVADYRLFLENGGNIGVNTGTPTEQLDINGGARIRNLNNANQTDDILSVDANGVLKRSKVNFGGRWTNTNTSTNLNNNNTTAPIFGNEDYKDDGNTLYEVSGNTLIVKEAGRYDIRANLSLIGINVSGSGEARTNVNARIAVNGTAVGAIGASGYIRWASNHDHSSVHINEILQLDANDVITVVTYREANSGTVNFSGSGQSSFMINKLK